MLLILILQQLPSLSLQVHLLDHSSSQWQRQTASGTRWTNVTDAGVFSGSNTNTLAITGADKATYDGYKFRVKLTSTAGAEEVISATGTLTFA